LIDAVERGDMTLEAALEEAEAKEQPDGPAAFNQRSNRGRR